MNKRNLRRAGVAGLIVSGVVLTGCTVTPEPDVMILRYTGGSQQGTKFKGCVDGGTKADGVVNDNDYTLMTSERTWNIAPDSDDQKDPIVVNTKPDAKGNAGASVKVWLKTDFFLNTSCEGKANSPVVKWWETVGRRYEADVNPEQSPSEQSKDAGWVNSLKANLVPVISRAVQDSGRQYTADELDNGLNDSWAAMEKVVETQIQTGLNANGSFYCGPGYDRKNPTNCPPPRVTVTNISLADDGVAQQRANLTAAEIEARTKLTRANAALAEAKILEQIAQNPNYVRLKELENQVELAKIQLQIAQACSGGNGNCTIVQGAAGVNVNAK